MNNYIVNEENINVGNLDFDNELANHNNSNILNKLSKSKIKGIKYIEEINYFKDNCTICLENFDSQSMVIILYCKHIFHYECLKDFMIKNKNKQEAKCPNCKNQVQILTEENKIKIEEEYKILNKNSNEKNNIIKSTENKNELRVFSNENINVFEIEIKNNFENCDIKKNLENIKIQENLDRKANNKIPLPEYIQKEMNDSDVNQEIGINFYLSVNLEHTKNKNKFENKINSNSKNVLCNLNHNKQEEKSNFKVKMQKNKIKKDFFNDDNELKLKKEKVHNITA